MTEDEQAVLDVLQATFDAIANRDKDSMRALLVPDGGVTHSRGDQVSHGQLGDMPERMPAGEERLEERIHDPLVRVDDDIAVVWAPYEFLIDGEVHHWGTNIVSFLKRDGRWRITGIVDNGRPGPR